MADDTITLTDNSVTLPEYATAVVPLTTVWTPPPGCHPTVSFLAETSCKPPHYSAAWYWGGYWSPAVCPHSYTVGCTAERTDAFFESTFDPDETTAWCVPSGWSCWKGSEVLRGETYGWWKWAGSGRLPGTQLEYSTSVAAFEIHWRESDLAILETPPLAGLTASESPSPSRGREVGSGSDSRSSATSPGETSSVQSTASTSATFVGSEEGTGGQSGLTKGAIAGIVVGVLAFLVIILAALFFLLRRRWSHSRQTQGGSNVQVGGPSPYELDCGQGRGHGASSEKYYAQVAEMPPSSMAAELGDAPPAARELPGSGFTTLPGPTPGGQHEMDGQSVQPPRLGWNADAAYTQSHSMQSAAGVASTTAAPRHAPAAVSPTGGSHHQVEPWAATAPSSESALGYGGRGVDELVERQAQLQLRRERLMELDRIEQEEEAIRHQLSLAKGQPGSM